MVLILAAEKDLLMVGELVLYWEFWKVGEKVSLKVVKMADLTGILLVEMKVVHLV